jgi:hypothetical protein
VEPDPTLSPAAATAWRLAVEQLGDDALVFADAIRRYVCAVDVAERLRTDWLDRGAPTFAEHSNGALYEHPLVKSIRGAEREAATFARALRITPASEDWQDRHTRRARYGAATSTSSVSSCAK